MHDDIVINNILIILRKLNGINVASMKINTVGDNTGRPTLFLHFDKAQTQSFLYEITQKNNHCKRDIWQFIYINNKESNYSLTRGLRTYSRWPPWCTNYSIFPR